MSKRRRKIIYLVTMLVALLAVAGAVGYGASLPKSPDSDVVAEVHDEEVVVLVHGMGRTEFSMLSLAWTLERQGYEVVNWGYSSTCCSVDELSDKLSAELRDIEKTNPTKIHFVGHSLGNIIVRSAINDAPPAQEGRIVMLAPPNDGAEVADRYVEYVGWLLEPLEDLTTDEDSTVRTLPPLQDRDVAVIAGRFDGKVAVEETHQVGASAREVVPAAHTFIMNRPDVHHLVVQFLESGEF